MLQLLVKVYNKYFKKKEEVKDEYLEYLMSDKTDPDGWMYMGLGLHNLYGHSSVFYEFKEPLGLNSLYPHKTTDVSYQPNVYDDKYVWRHIPIGIENL